jgi:predicted SAM-dependent methyltransferase
VAEKLHLGCGERYLEGYVNIDFPETEHSVMQGMRPDVLADIRQLEYPAQSVDEVRLHHVFEHFDRATALRLLIDWREWLVPGGLLHIETPDFERSARAFLVAGWLGPLGRGPLRRIAGRGRGTQLRHIFGSHEASWAVHWDGWSKARYRRTLEALSFDTLRFRRDSWQGTHNITVTARASSPAPPREVLLEAAEQLLRDSMVDDSESERRQHAHWVAALRA